MGKSTPSPDNSGVTQAQASATAAQQNYTLGEDQLNFEKQQWAQDEPIINQAAQSDLNTQNSTTAFNNEQQGFYQDNYQPLEKSYLGQVENYDSASQENQNAGAAQANVASQFDGARTAAQEQLEGYGIDPTSTRYAALDIGSRSQQAAAAAGQGTSAIQQTKLQGLGLEAGAINTGRGYATNASSLAGAATGAGQGASTSTLGGLSTSASAMEGTTGFTNAATGAESAYGNAVNGFNLAQNQSAQIANQGAAGFGSLAGGIFGGLTSPGFGTSALAMFADGGPTDPNAPAPSDPSATPGGAVPGQASPSAGKAIDDVPAMLTAGEWVMPKDVTNWYGQKTLLDLVDKARKGQQALAGRNDVGGKPAAPQPQQGIPAPTFVSRPQAQAIPVGFH